MEYLAPRVGFEPTTDRLTADCSATELPRKMTINKNMKSKYRHYILLQSTLKCNFFDQKYKMHQPENILANALASKNSRRIMYPY